MTRKLAAFSLALGLLSPNMGFAKDKYDITTRTDEAKKACVSYLIANAKDPSSIKLDDEMAPHYGARLSRNHIGFDMTGYGRNTFGAVLRHTWYCYVSCKEGKPCEISDLSEHQRL